VKPPVIPGNFYAAGLNYRAHIDWANKAHGTSYKVPQQADIGYRSNNALIGSGEDIVIPRDSSGQVDFEGELVAVIGKLTKNVSEEEALACVRGYTLGNDISERTWQRSDRTLWRAKNSDTFKPMGPFIATGLDPMKLTVTIKVNGATAAEYDTGKMLFSAQHYISEITKYMTLQPGDVLWLGTDGATEPDLKDGDTVEIIQKDIGTLRNPVKRARA